MIVHSKGRLFVHELVTLKHLEMPHGDLTGSKTYFISLRFSFAGTITEFTCIYSYILHGAERQAKAAARQLLRLKKNEP